MNHRISCWALIAWLAGAAPLYAFERSQVERSVVSVIKDGEGSGSGTVINTKGDVLTNWHVTQGSPNLVVVSKFSNGEHPARIIWEDDKRDLAVIRASRLKLPPVTLFPGELEEDSSPPVYAMGYPGAARIDSHTLKSSLTDGLLSHSFIGVDWPVTILQHSAVVTGGNSGGPLFDHCGRMIGVNTQRPHIMVLQPGPSGLQPNRVPSNSGVNWASHIEEAIKIFQARDTEFLLDESPCVSSSWTAVVAVAVVAGVAFAALGLTLRRPRQEIRRVVEKMAEPLSRSFKPGKNRPKAARSQAGPPKMVLTGFDPQGQPVKIELRRTDLDRPQGGFTIGRHPLLVDRVLNDDRVSRRHARFSAMKGTVCVEDLNSGNGTTLNGTRCAPFEPTTIQPGDMVNVGSTALRVSY